MTVVLSIGACINFAIIILGVPYVLWGKKPSGPGGLIWWLAVTLLVMIFGAVSLVAELALATSRSTIARLVLVLAVLIIVVMFFRRQAPSEA